MRRLDDRTEMKVLEYKLVAVLALRRAAALVRVREDESINTQGRTAPARSRASPECTAQSAQGGRTATLYCDMLFMASRQTVERCTERLIRIAVASALAAAELARVLRLSNGDIETELRSKVLLAVVRVPAAM